MEIATFGGGCFWCIEPIYMQIKGVHQVNNGYMGGHSINPSYKEICTGETGHAEVIQITFNPQEINFSTLLKIFWTIHDPTTLNRQGNDRGTQYRSVIFYHSSDQLAEATDSIANEATKIWNDPITTVIQPSSVFYAAEEYHQDYYNRNSSQPYCSIIITPKIIKFKSQYKHLLKSSHI